MEKNGTWCVCVCDFHGDTNTGGRRSCRMMIDDDDINANKRRCWSILEMQTKNKTKNNEQNLTKQNQTAANCELNKHASVYDLAH